ncbi:MAG: NUDIX domain-containing protein [Ignavibacteriae bacterium]|nr:NUDIX domain-containing protein [Ignavibacteriota bacterium]
MKRVVMPKIVSNTIQVHIAFIDKDKEPKYLSLQRTKNSKLYPNVWQVITGKMKKGETALSAALREVEEEIGIKPKKLWAIPYVTTYYDVKRELINISPVFGALIGRNQKVKLSKEHQAFKWLSFKGCYDKLFLRTHKEGAKFFHDYIINGSMVELFEIKVF